MNFRALEIADAFLIDPEMVKDERGSFGRTFCRDEFRERGLNPNLVQCSISYNTARGTLRGMHYQTQPHAEAKLVRCQAGASFHAIVDLRKESTSYCCWNGVELSARTHRILYVPEGVAHGFLTLEADSEIFYQMSETYSPDYAYGVRWNDPAFGIDWPDKITVISDRDSNYPDFIPEHRRES